MNGDLNLRSQTFILSQQHTKEIVLQNMCLGLPCAVLLASRQKTKMNLMVWTSLNYARRDDWIKFWMDPHKITIACLLQFYINARKFVEGRQIHTHMINKRSFLDIFIWNFLFLLMSVKDFH